GDGRVGSGVVVAPRLAYSGDPAFALRVDASNAGSASCVGSGPVGVVLRDGHDPEVGDVHAGAIPAGVVEDHPCRDWSVLALPCVAVGQAAPAGDHELPVPVLGLRRCPDEAFAVGPRARLECLSGVFVLPTTAEGVSMCAPALVVLRAPPAGEGVFLAPGDAATICRHAVSDSR